MSRTGDGILVDAGRGGQSSARQSRTGDSSERLVTIAPRTSKRLSMGKVGLDAAEDVL